MPNYQNRKLFQCTENLWDKKGGNIIVTITKEIDAFVEAYQFRLEKKTMNLYKKAVEQLVTHVGKPFDQIKPVDVRSWLYDLEKNGYAISTRNTRLFGIKLFYRFCREENWVTEEPTRFIPLSKVDDKLPYYLTPTQLTSLRELVKEKSEHRTIIEMLFATGVRISELAAMEKEDINWSERSIHIPKGKRKKARMVLFTRDCEEKLRAYLNERTDEEPFLFVNRSRSGPICIRTIQLRFSKYSEQLGFTITPHTLRHTFAAYLAVRGMPLACIQDLLGHDKPQHSQLYARIYDHARKEMYDTWM